MDGRAPPSAALRVNIFCAARSSIGTAPGRVRKCAMKKVTSAKRWLLAEKSQYVSAAGSSSQTTASKLWPDAARGKVGSVKVCMCTQTIKVVKSFDWRCVYFTQGTVVLTTHRLNLNGFGGELDF